MNKIKKVVISASGLVAGLFGAAPVMAQTTLTDNVSIQDSNIAYYNSIGSITPSMFVRTAINLLLGIAGVVSFVFLLWGGVQWILAGGDKEGTEKARKRITSALIGLAIVFSAYALIFIIRALFGVDIISVNLTRMS